MKKPHSSNKKKVLIISGAILCALLLAGLLTGLADRSKVEAREEPIFTIKAISYHGDKVTYWGLGYKVIRYVDVSPFEPFKNNRGAKFGSWFMQYDLKDQ